MTLADRLLCYFVCIFIQEILSFLVPNPEEQHLLANIFIDEEDTDSMADSWNDLLTQQNKVLFWNDLYEEDRSNREMVESTKTTKRTNNPRGKGPNVPNKKRKRSDKELRDLRLTVGDLKKRMVAVEASRPNVARATDVENNDDMNQEEHREANPNDPSEHEEEDVDNGNYVEFEESQPQSSPFQTEEIAYEEEKSEDQIERNSNTEQQMDENGRELTGTDEEEERVQTGSGGNGLEDVRLRKIYVSM